MRLGKIRLIDQLRSVQDNQDWSPLTAGVALTNTSKS